VGGRGRQRVRGAGSARDFRVGPDGGQRGNDCVARGQERRTSAGRTLSAGTQEHRAPALLPPLGAAAVRDGRPGDGSVPVPSAQEEANDDAAREGAEEPWLRRSEGSLRSRRLVLGDGIAPTYETPGGSGSYGI